MKGRKIITEAVEICPFCEGENIFSNYDIASKGFVVKCQHCGEEMMLCDECSHCKDNTNGKCDWHEVVNENNSEGHCFRGITFHKKAKVNGGSLCLL